MEDGVWDAGYWILVAGYWLLVTRHWLLVTGYSSLVTRHWLLVTRYLLLDAGCNSRRQAHGVRGWDLVARCRYTAQGAKSMGHGAELSLRLNRAPCAVRRAPFSNFRLPHSDFKIRVTLYLAVIYLQLYYTALIFRNS